MSNVIETIFKNLPGMKTEQRVIATSILNQLLKSSETDLDIKNLDDADFEDVCTLLSLNQRRPTNEIVLASCISLIKIHRMLAKALIQYSNNTKGEKMESKKKKVAQEKAVLAARLDRQYKVIRDTNGLPRVIICKLFPRNKSPEETKCRRVLAIGYAICSLSEEPTKKKGNAAAYGRAFKALYEKKSFAPVSRVEIMEIRGTLVRVPSLAMVALETIPKEELEKDATLHEFMWDKYASLHKGIFIEK